MALRLHGGVARVDPKTDARNARSRAAITSRRRDVRGRAAPVGPLLGTGRGGRLRDAPVLSIVASEWPERRQALEARVAAAVARATTSGHEAIR